MLIGLTAITRVFYFSAGNSLVYLVIALFRQKFPEFQLWLELVRGLANLSCPFDHCVNGENEPDKN